MHPRIDNTLANAAKPAAKKIVRKTVKKAAKKAAKKVTKKVANKTASKTAKKSAPVAKKSVKVKTAAKPATDAANKQSGNMIDWRVATLAHMRALIFEADPDMIEERKWRKPSNGMEGVPVWSHHGIVCTGETYKKVVKLTFACGASLDDPSHIFNSSLEGGTRRAIDIAEGEKVDARAFKTLIRAAVAANAMTRESRKGGAK